MINIGAYAKGSNPEIDKAIETMPHINAFLKQDVAEPSSIEQSFAGLEALAQAE